MAFIDSALTSFFFRLRLCFLLLLLLLLCFDDDFLCFLLCLRLCLCLSFFFLSFLALSSSLLEPLSLSLVPPLSSSAAAAVAVVVAGAGTVNYSLHLRIIHRIENTAKKIIIIKQSQTYVKSSQSIKISVKQNHT